MRVFPAETPPAAVEIDERVGIRADAEIVIERRKVLGESDSAVNGFAAYTVCGTDHSPGGHARTFTRPKPPPPHDLPLGVQIASGFYWLHFDKSKSLAITRQAKSISANFPSLSEFS